MSYFVTTTKSDIEHPVEYLKNSKLSLFEHAEPRFGFKHVGRAKIVASKKLTLDQKTKNNFDVWLNNWKTSKSGKKTLIDQLNDIDLADQVKELVIAYITHGYFTRRKKKHIIFPNLDTRKGIVLRTLCGTSITKNPKSFRVDIINQINRLYNLTSQQKFDVTIKNSGDSYGNFLENSYIMVILMRLYNMLPNNNPNSCTPCERNLLLSHVHTTLKPPSGQNQIMQESDTIINREIQTGLTGNQTASTITWCTIQNSYDLFEAIQQEQTKPTCICTADGYEGATKGAFDSICEQLRGKNAKGCTKKNNRQHFFDYVKEKWTANGCWLDKCDKTLMNIYFILLLNQIAHITGHTKNYDITEVFKVTILKKNE